MNPAGNIYFNSEFQMSESINRSPGTSRQYGTIANPGQSSRGTMDNLGQQHQPQQQQQRQPQQQLQQQQFQPSLYGDDRLATQYERYDRPPPTGYMDHNSQAWGYNVASTVNGAMNGANRYRQSSRRAPIPTAWTDSAPVGNPLLNFQNPLLNAPGGLAINGHSAHIDAFDPRTAAMMRERERDEKEQIIPTAIVIKNIPFSVRKEQLANLMTEMGLPQPYAFNYHFDGGIFRGLAFANFQSPEETKMVIDAMNQMDVNGRKLRVEYKKMLPEHERERIEREKREKRGQLQEQHQPLTSQQHSSIPTLSATIGAGQSKNSPLRDVDLNNPDTLSFYTELTLFKTDNSREALIFPPTITPEQRRQIHIIAHNLGFEHQSIGDGENRQLQIFKRSQASPVSALPALSYDPHRRGLSRAATIDFAESRAGVSASGYHTIGRHGPGPTLELPGSPDVNALPNNLRTAKSFADLRSYSPSPSATSQTYVTQMTNPVHVARYGEYSGVMGSNNQPTPNLTPSTPGGAPTMPTSNTMAESSTLAATMANMSIGFERTQNPGAIGSQRPGVSGATKLSRAPGSEWEAASFNGRRANGHVPRGSDSSDNARSNGGSSRPY